MQTWEGSASDSHKPLAMLHFSSKGSGSKVIDQQHLLACLKQWLGMLLMLTA